MCLVLSTSTSALLERGHLTQGCIGDPVVPGRLLRDRNLESDLTNIYHCKTTVGTLAIVSRICTPL